MASKTFFDVTQLVHWQGYLTGIPRVMQELAVRYSASDEPVVFVSWVKEIKAYCEVDFSRTTTRTEGIVYTSSTKTVNHEAAKKIATFKSRAKKHVKNGIKLVEKVSPELSLRLQAKATQTQLQSYDKCVPEANDVVFIPWGEWWDDNFLHLLESLGSKGVHIVPLIHDIGPIVQPQYSAHSTESLTAYCRRIVPISSLTICVSKNTRQDLENWLRQEELNVPKMGIFREGDDFKVSKPLKPCDPLFDKSGLKGGDYVMSVGTVELKKNHQLLYYVYKLAAERNHKLPKLLVVGRQGWHTEHLMELILKDPDTSSDIIFLQNTSDDELAWLYNNCRFTIQASFYEGWGIPVAESVARGIPCLAARTSSMVEIAPGIVEHFSANSPDECLDAMLRWGDEKQLEVARKKTILYKKTSWDDSFSQVKKLIGDIL